jgi:hypothetical protein
MEELQVHAGTAGRKYGAAFVRLICDDKKGRGASFLRSYQTALKGGVAKNWVGAQVGHLHHGREMRVHSELVFFEKPGLALAKPSGSFPVEDNFAEPSNGWFKIARLMAKLAVSLHWHIKKLGGRIF